MIATTIPGYGVKSEKFDLEISRKTMNFLKSRPNPIKFGGSAPVIEFLGGRMDWEGVESSVKNRKASLPKFDAKNALGLVIPDITDPRLAVAFSLHEEGRVTPAVTLSAVGSVWTAEPCAFNASLLTSSMIANFNSASVAALLALARGAFRKILINPLLAESRLTYVRATNDQFVPSVPDKSKRMMASHWPDWRRQEFDYKACIYALSVLENREKADYSRFVKKLERMGLVKSDITDCPFVQ